MKTAKPPMPAPSPLAQAKNDFTSEGAPPPGVVGTDLPRPGGATVPHKRSKKPYAPHAGR